MQSARTESPHTGEEVGTPMPLTPEQRSIRARLAAHSRWANASPEDARRQGEAAQRGLLERFAKDIDPEGSLDPEDRYRRAKHARNAHMARLALKSSQARKAVPDAA